MRQKRALKAVAYAALGFGLAVMAYGLSLSFGNPRTNEQDNFAWRVFATGGLLAGAALGWIIFEMRRPSRVEASGMPSPTLEKASLVLAMAVALPVLVFLALLCLVWLPVFLELLFGG